MKALFIVTGRGLGGDAMTALNAMNALERRGVTCEIALDASAHGTLFEKNGYEWHKISVPHAGGHSATKLSPQHYSWFNIFIRITRMASCMWII